MNVFTKSGSSFSAILAYTLFLSLTLSLSLSHIVFIPQQTIKMYYRAKREKKG